MSNPMERLRSLARAHADSADPWNDSLAFEAATALSTLNADPSLVVACRRMLAHHRTSAPLWWLLAHVLASANPAQAARERHDLFDLDETPERLAAALPLLDATERIGVVGWGRLPDRVFAERIDLDVVSIRLPYADPEVQLRRSRLDREVPAIEPCQIIEANVSLIVTPAHAVSSDAVLFGEGISELVAVSRVTPIWVVATVGTVLPRRLFSALERATKDDAIVTESFALDRFNKIVGPRGAEDPSDAVIGFDCPIPAELLKPL